MNPRVEVKTKKESRVDVFTYYYRNRVKLLEKKKLEYDKKKREGIL
jgi:hypothetical protein